MQGRHNLTQNLDLADMVAYGGAGSSFAAFWNIRVLLHIVTLIGSLLIKASQVFFIEVDILKGLILVANESEVTDNREEMRSEFEDDSRQETSAGSQRLLSVMANHYDVHQDDHYNDAKDTENDTRH